MNITKRKGYPKDNPNPTFVLRRQDIVQLKKEPLYVTLLKHFIRFGRPARRNKK